MLQVLYIFIPMLVAIFVPLLYKRMKHIHTGWFVLAVPATLAIIYATYIAQVAKGEVFTAELPWIPSLDISVISYLDGLSLLFSFANYWYWLISCTLLHFLLRQA